MNQDVLMPLFLEAISQDNILPLTSTCNASCIFCSHRQNPPGSRAYTFPPLGEALLKELLVFLDGGKKIVIGESSSRLCEGEPLTHPRFFYILQELRVLYPQAPVQVTTNGMNLSKTSIQKLQRIGGKGSRIHVLGDSLELIISLNCVSARYREFIMGDRRPARTLERIRSLGTSGIVFHGSVVAMPHVTGWDELANTLYFLDKTGARTTRVFLPGFTHLAPKHLQFTSDLWDQIHNFYENIKGRLSHPVILEPPLKKKIEARVEGVIPGTPAWQAGIRRGDIIQRIDGVTVRTAAEAFFRIQDSANPLIDAKRAGTRGCYSVSRHVEKESGQGSGVVLNRDLEPMEIEAVAGEIKGNRSNNPLLLTSVLAEPLWKSAIAMGLLPDRLSVVAAASGYFGGTIACAGLLTSADFQEALKAYLASHKAPDLVIIPLKPFDRKGFDLQGKHYRELVSSFPHLRVTLL